MGGGWAPKLEQLQHEEGNNNLDPPTGLRNGGFLGPNRFQLVTCWRVLEWNMKYMEQICFPWPPMLWRAVACARELNGGSLRLKGARLGPLPVQGAQASTVGGRNAVWGKRCNAFWARSLKSKSTFRPPGSKARFAHDRKPGSPAPGSQHGLLVRVTPKRCRPDAVERR